jgi:hypothetical protein
MRSIIGRSVQESGSDLGIDCLRADSSSLDASVSTEVEMDADADAPHDSAWCAAAG